MLMAEGKHEEAAQLKRQLQPFTLSATYQESRVPECITSYNDLLLLDLDKMTAEQLTHCDAVLRQDENVLFFFVSLSGNGLKAGIYMKTREAERIRLKWVGKEEIRFAELEM